MEILYYIIGIVILGVAVSLFFASISKKYLEQLILEEENFNISHKYLNGLSNTATAVDSENKKIIFIEDKSKTVIDFKDLISVETNSQTATVHFPGAQDPIEGPIADAGDDQTVDAGILVTLDGSGSYHTDGEITEYYWEQTSGPSVLLSDEESI